MLKLSHIGELTNVDSMNPCYHFMVNFTMGENSPEMEFLDDLIPYQEIVVDRYFSEGKLVNYALSLDQGKLWAIFQANSELEVLEMINNFPLTEFMQVEISLLSTYQVSEFPSPVFSLN